MAEYVTPSGHVVVFDDGVVLPGKLSIGSHGYAQLWNGETVEVLHRWLLGLVKGDKKIGDHINHDILDNRRCNLRVVNGTESNLNRVVAVRDLPKGVYLAKGRYHAQIKRYGKTQHLGTYDTPEEASAAYLVAAV